MFTFKNVKGIIFDLDDTLVKTKLDFAAMKYQLGCSEEADILSFIAQLKCPEQQALANRIVLEHELDDAHTSRWMPGAESFVQQAMLLNLPLAIVTRNCQQATQVKLRNNKIPIDLVLTRDDAPPKPDPTALLQIASKWQIMPADIAYIGDYIYDIQAAHNGNMQAWLFTDSLHNKNHEYAQKLTYIAPNAA